MRFGFLLIILLPVLDSAAAAQSPTNDHPWNVELNRRADSLSQLNPARELEAAIDSGDWRFLGVRGYVVVAPGVKFVDPLYPKDSTAMRVIEGTSDAMIGDAGTRFNTVATDYADRYNRLLLERLRRAKNRQ